MTKHWYNFRRRHSWNNCLMLTINSKTTIFQYSKNYGSPTRVTRLKVAPNMADSISMFINTQTVTLRLKRYYFSEKNIIINIYTDNFSLEIPTNKYSCCQIFDKYINLYLTYNVYSGRVYVFMQKITFFGFFCFPNFQSITSS